MTGENLAFQLAESFAEKNSKIVEMRVIVEACPLPTFISDSNGECVYVNQAYQEMVGRPYRACLGTRWRGFILPEDLPTVLETWMRCVETAEVYEGKYRIVRPGGVTVCVNVRAVPLPSGGFVGYFSATEGCKFVHQANEAREKLLHASRQYVAI